METSRFKARGREILHYIGPSTFSQYTVAADISIIVVTPKIVANRSCLLDCGITTGHGAAVKVAKVDEGSTVAVFGLSVIQSTMKNKASKIIGMILMTPKRSGLAKSVRPIWLALKSYQTKLYRKLFLK